ncbi:uncharacterized protein LOC127079601 [Lathyrus oleraceus]|uniref:uncharacterized protein LOC127079601 n=1 Tax=Pisum sativum TaxID=3888 RepID=UPI0021D0C833|nr:uncharacterized protein LOC127079601 [Pisum sativum]
MDPSPEVEPHSKKDDDSSKSEKDMAAEGLCSLGKTVSGKKSVASTTANASHSEKHDFANNKRKVRQVSESDEDVEEDVPDISPVKRTTVRKSLMKVAVVHLDNISFHLEDGAAKWKFLIQRRVAVERELGKDVVEVKEVMDLIKNAELMKTVAGLSQCYKGLVKEFIVKISEDIADKNNKEFCKVFVRGKCITFSPTVINRFLGRGTQGACELEATDNEVCKEITARQVKEWPSKKHLPAGKLTVKYAILHKIGSANWHASTNAVKLPISFPLMICGIILSQHPRVLSTNDLPSRRKPLLSVNYKLFEGSHVENIVMTSAVKKPASKGGLIDELKETYDVGDDLYDTNDVGEVVKLYVTGDVEGDARWGSVLSVLSRLMLAEWGGGVL